MTSPPSMHYNAGVAWRLMLRVSSSLGFGSQPRQQCPHLFATHICNRKGHCQVTACKISQEYLKGNTSNTFDSMNSTQNARVWQCNDSLALLRNEQTVSCSKTEFLLIHSHCRRSFLRKKWGRVRRARMVRYTAVAKKPDRLLGQTLHTYQLPNPHIGLGCCRLGESRSKHHSLLEQQSKNLLSYLCYQWHISSGSVILVIMQPFSYNQNMLHIDVVPGGNVPFYQIGLIIESCWEVCRHSSWAWMS